MRYVYIWKPKYELQRFVIFMHLPSKLKTTISLEWTFSIFCWILLLSTFKWYRDGSLKKQLCLKWSIFTKKISVYTWIYVLIQAVSSFKWAIPLRSHFNALSYSKFSPTVFFRPRLMYRQYHRQHFSAHRLR